MQPNTARNSEPGLGEERILVRGSLLISYIWSDRLFWSLPACLNLAAGLILDQPLCLPAASHPPLKMGRGEGLPFSQREKVMQPATWGHCCGPYTLFPSIVFHYRDPTTESTLSWPPRSDGETRTALRPSSRPPRTQLVWHVARVVAVQTGQAIYLGRRLPAPHLTQTLPLGGE